MNEKKFDNNILNAFYEIMDFLPIIMDDEVAICVTQGESYDVARSTDVLTMKEGTPLNPKAKALVGQGEIFVGEYVSEAGAHFKSYTIPIKGQSGKVEGAILLAKSLAKKRQFTSAFENITSSLEQITLAINDLNINVQDVVNTNEDILSIVEEANTKTADTNDILSFIQGISTQTNMLGLNAAIEAARAGEYGKGFDVVAKEIRKLSTSTSESIKKVDTVLKNVSESIKTINKKVEESNGMFGVQASSLEEIAASIEELNSTAQEMNSFMETM